jgi:cold shock protein
MKCPIHGDNCPGDDGGFFIDGNHPDDMFSVGIGDKQMTGYVNRIVADKGFGFIKGEDGHDYFFHRTDVNGHFDDMAEDAAKGQQVGVTFDSVPSPKGPRAGNVQRVDWPN